MQRVLWRNRLRTSIHRRELADVRASTEARDPSVDALDDWMAHLLPVARVAFEEER